MFSTFFKVPSHTESSQKASKSQLPTVPESPLRRPPVPTIKYAGSEERYGLRQDIEVFCHFQTTEICILIFFLLPGRR